MAAKKNAVRSTSAGRDRPRPAAAKKRAWCPYMYLLPSPGGGHDWVSGVLRRTYNGRANDVVEFVRSKLHPVDAPAPGQLWKSTAVRSEVLLPPGGGSDHFLDPKTLTERYAEQLLSWQTSLLSVIKITLDSTTLNEPWSLVHAWTHSSICRARGLPVILVQHAPFLAGVEGVASHLHVLILSRRMAAGSNFGGLDFELTSDEGHPPLYRDFKAYAERF
jgi:hypothetical protein